MPQGLVGESLDQGADERHHDDRDQEEEHEADDKCWDVGDGTGLAQDRRADADRDECGDHEDVAVGKVDELDNPVDHGVAKGDERIDRAERHGVQELVEPEDAEHERKEAGDGGREEELAAHALGSHGTRCCCHRSSFRIAVGVC